MSDYPKKFAFVKLSNSKVEQIQIAYTSEVVFTPAEGYQMVEVPFDSPVDVGWSYVLNEDTAKYEFVAPVAVVASSIGAGGGKQRPPGDA